MESLVALKEEIQKGAAPSTFTDEPTHFGATRDARKPEVTLHQVAEESNETNADC